MAYHGSFSDLGKKVLKLFLREELHPNLIEKFLAAFPGISFEMICKQVYNNDMPDVHLSAYGKFVARNSDFPEMRKMIKDSLQKFFKFNIQKEFPDQTKTPLHFVGEMAFLCSEILNEVAMEHGMIIAEIISDGTERLIGYHQVKKELRKLVLKKLVAKPKNWGQLGSEPTVESPSWSNEPKSKKELGKMEDWEAEIPVCSHSERFMQSEQK